MGPKRVALGKGLDALIPELKSTERKNLIYCGIEEIRPNPHQPRKHFDDAKLQELANSIKEKGILEPLLVRKIPEGYELIVGERRWRAAQKAGLKEVPVVVKEIDPTSALELSLIENLQREDLNPIEEAEAYQRLIEEFHLSHEALSARLGKDRTTITNAIRLLKLPSEIKEHLLQNHLSPGHARAILSLEDQEKQKELCHLILRKGLSVRQTEALAKKWSGKPKKKPSEKTQDDLKLQLASLQESLRRYLGTKVLIHSKGKKGRIEIEFYSHEDLERIVESILKNA